MASRVKFVSGLVSVILFAVAMSTTGAQAQSDVAGDVKSSGLITSVPRTMAYQAALNDSDGDPVRNTTLNVDFRIFDALTEGNQLWTEVVQVTTDQRGNFTAILSNLNLPFDEEYFLELQIEDDPQPLEPRQKLHMSPYAAVADTSECALTVVDNAITSPSIQDGSIQFADMGQNGATTGQVMKWDGSAWVADNDQTDGGGSGWTDDGNYIRLETSTDSVGIGTATPAEKLDIIGSVLVSGKATIGPGHTNTGANAFVAGAGNTASGAGATVSGGAGNTASGDSSTVGGGSNNTADMVCATIAGGRFNMASNEDATVGGGYADTASGNSSTVSGGANNTASGVASTISGGAFITAGGDYAAVGGGGNNSVGGNYSTISGGYADTITATGSYSYLFGIGSKLTEDSTFMVDMPHVRFGDEASGYEFPVSDGSNGQVMATDGDGQLSWTTFSGGNWTVTDSVLYTNDYWGLARGGAGNVLYGDSAHTHANFGVACTTGTSGLDLYYATVSGGYRNRADSSYATVGGGLNNTASGFLSTVPGGSNNTASGSGSAAGGGSSNIVSGFMSTVGGGYGNEANGDYSTVPGGRYNHADSAYTFAAGRGAKAVHKGAFVWADTTDADFSSTGDNQFLIRAGGGVGINTNSPGAALAIGGTAGVDGIMFPDGTLQTTALSGGGNWTVTDSVLYTNDYWGLAKGGAGNALLGDSSNTHVNLGVVCTTGTSGADFYYATISGGWRNKADSTYATVGGGVYNWATGVGSIISGGLGNEASGRYSTIAGGRVNMARGEYATVAGGGGFYAADSNAASGDYSFVGGGFHHTASGGRSTVSGGYDNDASGFESTVGGGHGNEAWGNLSTVGGGLANRASGYNATLTGGKYNVASNDYATVGGGESNTASNFYSTVGGGYGNEANGIYSTVPGGGYNHANSAYTFAAGRRAKAVHKGAFVWADTTDADFSSTGDNQFLIRAGGGVGINTNSPGAALHVGGTAGVDGIMFPDGTLQTTASSGSGNWAVTDSVLYTNNYWGLARGGANNKLWGDYVYTMVNLGVACTTGTSGQNYGYATVGGGVRNKASDNYSTISGGSNNTASGSHSTVGGGDYNTASESYNTVGGGFNNNASDNWATIGGGYGNKASGEGGIVGGGAANEANGDYSTVPGGVYNNADSAYTFAAGRRAKAVHSGAFVWGDATDAEFSSTGDNQFLIRAGGGVGINTNSPGAALHVGGTAGVDGIMFPDGTLQTTALSGGNWTVTDSVLYTNNYLGIARGNADNKLWGDNAFSMVNLGVACTTGTSGQNYSYATVGGGRYNTASGLFASVGGGSLNSASGHSSTVGGGSSNAASNYYATVGGGEHNFARGYCSVVAGGGGPSAADSNLALGYNSAIGGGKANNASGANSTVGGGSSNSASGNWSTVGGGESNAASNYHATVGGGRYNFARGYYSVVAGGGGFNAADSNLALGDFSAIGGGKANNASGSESTVGGGHDNTASGRYATIGGGRSETVQAVYGGVASGYSNRAGNAESDTAAFIGGGYDNSATAKFATVSGGGSNTASSRYAMIGGGRHNTASDLYATVSGGYLNTASGRYATVAGGHSDTVQAVYGGVASGYNNRAGDAYHDTAAFIGGGYDNSATAKFATVGGGIFNNASSYISTVSGGFSNIASGDNSTIGGGRTNTASGLGATVGGGSSNTASSNYYSTVGGGQRDTASGDWSTVGGGADNKASGNNSTVGGGYNNVASAYCAVIPGGCNNLTSGDYSIAFGSGAKAVHNGSFVWADASNDDFESTNENQIMMLASGGTWIYSDPDLISGVTIHPGASAWATYSDRDLKENLTAVDGKEILQKLSSLPINEWNFKAQSDNIKHVGPTAQDFYATFGLGDDDKTISTVDPSGVALAGVQALLDKIEQLEVRIAELESK